MNKKEYDFYYNRLKNTTYNSQDHWDVFDENYYKLISDYERMFNFRRNGISNMLETGLPSQEREKMLFSKECYSVEYNEHETQEVVKRFAELQEMIGEEFYEYFENDISIGSPRHHKYTQGKKQFKLNFDDLYHAYAAWQLRRSLNLFFADGINNIVEIGAGYGNLALKIKRIYKNVKYVIVDLPEVLLIQHYYLSKHDPDYKIVNLINPDEFLHDNVGDYDCDFLLIPFHEYSKISFSMELVINNRSLGEMPKEMLKEYVDWIEKNIKTGGLFYTVNRYVFTKSKDKNKIRDYPFDSSWSAIISQPQWLQTHLHEFLLQRNCDPVVPFDFLLKSFPITTPPPGPIMKKIQTQDEWLNYQGVR